METLIRPINLSKHPLRSGIYTYQHGAEYVYILVDDRFYIEYYQGGKSWVKSAISWINEQECEITFMETNTDWFELPYGSKMRMRFNTSQNNLLRYDSVIEGEVHENEIRRIS